MKRTSVALIVLLMMLPSIAARADAPAESRAPRVVFSFPTNGRQDVNPGLTLIFVQYDRPISGAGYSIFRNDLGDFPEVSGQPYLPDNGKNMVLALPVTLRPNTRYGLSFNGDAGARIAGRNGIPARPFVLAFATAPAAEEPGQVYQDPQGFWTLRYPAGWSVGKAGSETHFSADAEGRVAVAVSLQIKAVSPESLADQIEAILAKNLDNYRRESIEKIDLAGYPSVLIGHRYSQGGRPMRGIMEVLVRDRVGFVARAYAPDSDYAAQESRLRSVLKSLRVTEFPEAPLYDRWQTYRSARFVYHYLPDTYAASSIRSIADGEEQAMDAILKTLQVSFERTVEIYLYPSEEAFFRATYRDAGFAINEAREIHVQWFSAKDHQTRGHELVHVVTVNTLGDASEALLGEGIAVALNQDQSIRDQHAVALQLLEEDKLISLSEMLGAAWGNYDYAYPVSGSFIGFLLESRGADALKRLWTHTDFQEGLRQVYGEDLELLEAEWLEMLAGE